MWSRYGSLLICCGKIISSPWRPEWCYRDFLMNMAQKQISSEQQLQERPCHRLKVHWVACSGAFRSLIIAQSSTTDVVWKAVIELFLFICKYLSTLSAEESDKAESSWKDSKGTMLFAVFVCRTILNSVALSKLLRMKSPWVSQENDLLRKDFVIWWLLFS